MKRICAIAATSLLWSTSWAEPTPRTEADTIAWDQLSAKVSSQYKGDNMGVFTAKDGARIACVLQRLEGRVGADGLWLVSTVTNAPSERFRVHAATVGRAGSSSPVATLAPHGRVVVEGGLARWIRPGVVEEYSVGGDGIRQDFVLAERPRGDGDLRLELAVSGAQAEPAADGARLILDGSGRKLAYNRLRVTDANDKELTARIETTASDRLAIVVADANAAYPLRIDPTFSDANWVSMGGILGVNGTIYAAVTDGSGNLYVGGTFNIAGQVSAANVAKWNGSSWSALGLGTGGVVLGLAVDGLGNLYAGGSFASAGGIPVNNIAKWNGSSWSALGAGVNDSIRALAVDGSGNLYAGGYFTTADGSAANYIAKWNGAAWSTLGAGMNSHVLSLAVDGSGNLYAGGNFTTAGGSSASRVAKWNGSAWSALGSGMDHYVYALAVDGAGNLYAGGYFTTAGGIAANYIAKWNGSNWSGLGGGTGNYVISLLLDGSGNLYAGGYFTAAGGNSANYVAKWNGTTWSALGSGMNHHVYALALDGSGNLHAGGSFSTAGGSGANGIAKWNGSGWSALGSGLGGNVMVLALDGSGNLYAGGGFTTAGGSAANYVAKWNGSSWSALGSGMNASVCALAVDGAGNLFAGGNFTTAGGSAANYIAKWNGSSWSALGSGIGGNSGFFYRRDRFYNTTTSYNYNPYVKSLLFASGQLYVGGGFTTAGGVSANGVAVWNGSTWSSLGLNISGWYQYNNSFWVDQTSLSFHIDSLARSASGILYAGGYFAATAGSDQLNNIGQWNGSAWSPLGSGMNSEVRALAVDASGNLYASGGFTTADGMNANRIAKWNGSAWSALGSGMNNYVNALVLSGSGTLYAGGDFTVAGTNISGFVAHTAPPAPPVATSYQVVGPSSLPGNQILDSEAYAGTFDISITLYDQEGLSNNAASPKLDIVKPPYVLVNNDTFDAKTFSDSGRVLDAVWNGQRFDWTDENIGTYTLRWSAENSNGVSRVDSSVLSNGTVMTFTIVDDDSTGPVLSDVAANGSPLDGHAYPYSAVASGLAITMRVQDAESGVSIAADDQNTLSLDRNSVWTLARNGATVASGELASGFTNGGARTSYGTLSVTVSAAVVQTPGSYVLTVTNWNADGDGLSDQEQSANAYAFTVFVPPPEIHVQSGLLSFGNQQAGTIAGEQSYTVSATSLSENLRISAPVGFEISTTSGSGFASTLDLVPTSGDVPSTTIYVRFAPGSVGPYAGNITHAASPATTANKAVSGTGVGQVTFATASMTVTEGVAHVSLPVQLSDSHGATVHVAFAGTATTGVDYTPLTTTLVFRALGPANQAATFTLLQDRLVEGTETIVASFASLPSFLTAGTNPSITVTIADDEPTVSLAASTANFAESNGTASVTVSKTTPTGTATVEIALGGTATPGADYFALGGPVHLRNPGRGGDGDGLGYAIAALGDDRVAVGRPFADIGAVDAGAVEIFDREGNLMVTITNPAPAVNDQFGCSLAAAGTNLLVGALLDDTGASDSGSAYLFSPDGVLIATIANPTPGVGDFFGGAVAVAGTNLIIAAERDDTGAGDAGIVYVFNAVGTLLATIANPSPAISDFFGTALASAGTNILITARGEDTGAANAGAAYLYSPGGVLIATIANPAPAVNDYFGLRAASVGTNLVVATPWDDAGATDAGSVYVFSPAGTLLASIANPAPAVNDYFGWDVSGFGTNLLIGAYGDDGSGTDSGRAYLLSPSGTLLATYTNPTPAASDQFGYGICAVGDRVVIGAYGDDATATDAGIAHVFTAAGSLVSSLANPMPPAADKFGFAVALAGTNVLVGVPGDDIGAADSGTVSLLAPDGTVLVTITNPSPAAADEFGSAVAAAGTNLLVGAPGDDASATDSGRAYLFSPQGTLLATLNNPTPAVGDNFAFIVAAAGTNLLIGAPYDDTGAGNAGSVYLFSPNGTLLASIANPSPGANDAFGYGVAGVGTNLLVGARVDDTGATDAGAAYLFAPNGTLLASIPNPFPGVDDSFGIAVAAVGTNLLVGAYSDSAGAADAGSAYLFSPSGTLIANYTNPAPQVADQFGFSVAGVGPYVLIGARVDDVGTTDAGAAYLYDQTGRLLCTITNPAPAGGDEFGYAVAGGDNGAFVVGAFGDDDPGTDGGSVWHYSLAQTGSNLLVQLEGATTSTVVQIVGLDDLLGEGSESASFTLSNIAGGATGTPSAATLTVLDNDPAPPVVASPSVSNVLGSSASFYLNIVETNNAPVTEWGLFWSTIQGFVPPAEGSQAKVAGYQLGNGPVGGLGIGGMPAGAIIYWRGYASNSAGYGFTEEASFRTGPAAGPATTTGSTSFVATWTPAAGATNYFIDVSENAAFTSLVAGYSNRNAGNAASLAVTGLVPNRVYAYRVRWQDGDGTSGNSTTIYVMTLPTAGSVETLAVVPATATTADGGGNVTSDGGGWVRSRGVCWSSNSLPTTSDASTTNGLGLGTYASTLTALAPGQTYTARAYVVNGTLQQQAPMGVGAPGPWVRALEMDNSGRLFVGGEFFNAGGLGGAHYLAAWQNNAWQACFCFNSYVYDLLHDGSNNVYAAGYFTSPANYVAKWNGSSWQNLGSGPGGPVHALAFSLSGQLLAARYDGVVLLWNGTSWASVGNGPPYPTSVAEIAGGSVILGNATYGPYLRCVAGDPLAANSYPGFYANDLQKDAAGNLYVASSVSGVWKWNGSSWSQLGGAAGYVRALSFGGDGQLFAAGDLGGMMGIYGVSRWDGSAWRPDIRNIGTVLGLATPGTGTVYVGGQIGSRNVEHFARNTVTTYGEPVTFTMPALVPPMIVDPGLLVGTNGQPFAFDVRAWQSGGIVPDTLTATGLPSGATFSSLPSGTNRVGTFTWNPSGAANTYPIRFTATAGAFSTSLQTRIYVKAPAEPVNGQGVPISQTNWSPSLVGGAVTGSTVVVSNASVSGIGYELWQSPGPVSPTMNWTRVVNETLATNTLNQLSVTDPGTDTFFQVVLAGAAPVANSNLFAVLRPPVGAGVQMLAPPVQLAERSLNGPFGDTLGAVLSSGDRVYLMEGTNWMVAQWDGADWIDLARSLPATNVLRSGQGVLVARGTPGSAPVFSGPVGNRGTNVAQMGSGWNVVGLSEGKPVAIATGFDQTQGGTQPYGNYDETAADVIAILQPDGTWKRLLRLPEGYWLDLQTGASTTNTLKPGDAVYYYRHPVQPLQVRF